MSPGHQVARGNQDCLTQRFDACIFEAFGIEDLFGPIAQVHVIASHGSLLYCRRER